MRRSGRRDAWRRARAEHDELAGAERASEQEMDMLRFQIKDIADARLVLEDVAAGRMEEGRSAPAIASEAMGRPGPVQVQSTHGRGAAPRSTDHRKPDRSIEPASQRSNRDRCRRRI